MAPGAPPPPPPSPPPPLYEQFGAPTLSYRNRRAYLEREVFGPPPHAPAQQGIGAQATVANDASAGLGARRSWEEGGSGRVHKDSPVPRGDVVTAALALAPVPGGAAPADSDDGRGTGLFVDVDSLHESEARGGVRQLQGRGGGENVGGETHHYDDYGNCIQVMRCGHHHRRRRRRDHSGPTTPPRPTFFALRPWGARRNFLTVSRIVLPADDCDGDVARRSSLLRRNTIDLGDTVRQVARCGRDDDYHAGNGDVADDYYGYDDDDDDDDDDEDGGSSMMDDDTNLWWFMARTRTHCSVLRVTNSGVYSDDDNGQDGDRRVDRRRCTTRLDELHRFSLSDVWAGIDGPSSSSSHGGGGGVFDVPRHCAGYRSDGGPFGSPTFAVIGHRRPGDTVHRVTVGNDGVDPITTYTFPTVSDLRLLEFASRPVVLWASGSEKRGPFENALFQLDLRSRSAVRVWSPGNAEYYPEGMCTLRSILQHPTRDHGVYVTTSLRNMYELDARMPTRVVARWCIPGMCESVRTGGDLLAPVVCDEPVMWSSLSEAGGEIDGADLASSSVPLQPPPPPPPSLVVSVGKAPRSYGLHLYQSPTAPPRFVTQPLESGPCHDYSSGGGAAGDGNDTTAASSSSSLSSSSSIARSTTFALPDRSSYVFSVGLAAIRVPLDRVLVSPDGSAGGGTPEGRGYEVEGDLDFGTTEAATDAMVKALGYDRPPSRCLCVLTMTSVGDVYCHCLLECDRGETRGGAVAFDGLPAGTSAVAVPSLAMSSSVPRGRLVENEDEDDDEAFLPIRLSNKYPVPSGAILPHVSSRDDIHPFRAIDLPPTAVVDGNGDSRHSDSGEEGDDKVGADGETTTTAPPPPSKIDRIRLAVNLAGHPMTPWELGCGDEAGVDGGAGAGTARDGGDDPMWGIVDVVPPDLRRHAKIGTVRVGREASGTAGGDGVVAAARGGGPPPGDHGDGEGERDAEAAAPLRHAIGDMTPSHVAEDRVRVASVHTTVKYLGGNAVGRDRPAMRPVPGGGPPRSDVTRSLVDEMKELWDDDD